MESKLIEQTNSKVDSLNPWNRDHDNYLINLIRTYGESNWQMITENMNKKFKGVRRTDKDCRRRWKLFQGTSGKKQLWSDRERYLLLIAHQKYKNRWSEVARMLNKSSRNLIKNRFYTLFRKIRNRVKNDDVFVSSLLDLLEIYYVLSLVDQYFNEPVEKLAEEKNYAHKLVQRMDRKKVILYKEKLEELHHTKGTMEKLFKECASIYSDVEELPKEIAIEEEPMECNQIDLNESVEEVKIKITLPYPSDFNNEGKISDDEKDEFWRSAFLNKEAKSAQIPYSTGTVMSSFPLSQAHSAGPMRDDERLDFSQFIDPFEPNQKKVSCQYPNQLFPPSTGTPNTQLSSPFYSTTLQPLLGVQNSTDLSAGSSLTISAFRPYNGTKDVVHSQQQVNSLSVFPDVNIQRYPNPNC